MDRDELKSYVQDETIIRWVANMYYGYGLISMGVGKSRIIALAISKYLQDHPEFDYLKYDFPILIVVNSSTLRDRDLPLELKKWKVTVKVKIVCYQTSYRWVNKKIGLLLTDELDFAITEGERYLQLFHRNRYDAWLGLTGSLIEGKEETTKALFGRAPFIEFPLASAQEHGLINKTEIWIHEVELYKHQTTDAPYGEVAKYKWICRKIAELKERISEIYDTFKSGRYIDMSEKLELNEELNMLKSKKEYWESRGSNPNNRMQMMHSARSLSDYAKILKALILKEPANKVIIFGELTSEVDLVADYAYHGKKADDDILEKLNLGDIRELGVVRKVNRGVNFMDLNHAIVHSYSSSITNAVQAYIGRMVRLEPDKIARIHFLVSYYMEGPEKVYCQNYTWIQSIFSSRELKHLKLNYYNTQELLKSLK